MHQTNKKTGSVGFVNAMLMAMLSEILLLLFRIMSPRDDYLDNISKLWAERPHFISFD